jgi:tetratricopeptide (TPR) repeat protein
VVKNSIIIIALVLVTLFVGFNLRNKGKENGAQQQVYMAIVNGQFKNAIALLEKNEGEWKRAEEYLMYGFMYSIVANEIHAFYRRPQSNLPDVEKLYLKSFDLIRKSIENSTGYFKETACLYLSRVYRQKEDYEGQYKSIEEAALCSPSVLRKSFYYYYIAKQIMERVNQRDLNDHDRWIKARAREYCDKSLSVYPENYQTLIYLSNNCDEWEKKEFYNNAARVLSVYEKEAKKHNVDQVIKLLDYLDPNYLCY